MIRHSDSLILVWKIAELEARNLGSREIEPAHFFLGLLKKVDLSIGFVADYFKNGRQDSIEQLAKDVSELKSAFSAGKIESTPTRRQLRSFLHTGHDSTEGRLRRSIQSRELFRSAESSAKSAVRPIHLLASLLGQVPKELREFLENIGADQKAFIAAADRLAKEPGVETRSKIFLRKTGNVPGLEAELKRMRNGHKH
ncbi:MAG: hypothetical protein M0Q93_09840 [Terrimicrobiaceae bacterium]|nr:hypothetical protein [Terrimicrobiaceae bacterium]